MKEPDSENCFCRLCLNQIEDNLISFNDNYILNIMKILFPDLIIEIFENPLICNFCLKKLESAYNIQKSLIENSLKPEPETEKRTIDVCKICLIVLLDNDNWNPKNSNVNVMLKRIFKNPPTDLHLKVTPTVCENCMDRIQNIDIFVTHLTINNKKVMTYCNKFNITTVTRDDEGELCSYLMKLSYDEMENNNFKCVTSTKPPSTPSNKKGVKTTIPKVSVPYTPNKNFPVPIKQEIVEPEPVEPEIIPETVVEVSDETAQQPINNVVDVTLKSEVKLEDETPKQLYVKLQRFPLEDLSDENIRMILLYNNAEFFVDVKRFNKKYFIKCPVCSVTVKRLASHMQSLHNDNFQGIVYKCTLCPYKTKNKGDLKMGHSLTHKRAEDIEMHYCELCSYGAKRKAHLQRHWLTVHAQHFLKTEYKCDKCDYKTKVHSYLTGHMRIHRNPDEEPMHRCKLCLYQTFRRKHLVRHMLTHNNKDSSRMFKCSECKYETYHKSHLKTHLIHMHRKPEDIVWYNCDFCEYKTKYKYYMQKHTKQRHIKDESTSILKCDQCSYTSNNKGYLKNHIIYAHFTTNPFQCPDCPFKSKCKSYYNRHVLTRHKKIELDNKYNCQICEFKTSLKSLLKRHMMVHVSGKNYTCPVCHMKYKYKGDMTKHMKQKGHMKDEIVVKDEKNVPFIHVK